MKTGSYSEHHGLLWREGRRVMAEGGGGSEKTENIGRWRKKKAIGPDILIGTTGGAKHPQSGD